MNKFHPCKICEKNRKSTYNIKQENLTHIKNQLIKKFGSCDYEFNIDELSEGYTKRKLHIKCTKCEHEMFTYIVNILHPRNGKHYCRVCNKKDRLLETMSYKERCEAVTNGKITPIEPYIDSRTKILHRCNVCGYIWEKIPVKNTPRHAGCPKCKKKILFSKAEEEIKEYIHLIYNGNIELHQRILDGQEIDIYLPDIKIGFEINGLY